MINEPYLSLQLRTFSPEQPDSWQPVIDLAIAHMRQHGKKITLDTTAYSIPWFEPFSFYADHTNAVKTFLK